MRILLVADHTSVVAQVTDAVSGWDDVDVVHVSMPYRALALLDEGAVVDVVVADNDTHPTGGLSLCREVKARGQMGRDMPPVVLLIARDQDRWLANWAQADAVVLKPADPFDLGEVLRAVAAGQPVPALPGITADPTPSLLDRAPGREIARATGSEGRSDEGPPDELSAEAHAEAS